MYLKRMRRAGRRCVTCAGLLALVLTAAAYLPREAWADGDQIIYGDALANGWQDWSWCARDLASADTAHTGSHSVKVTYTAAWQGFYLHHSAIDTSLYSGLTFWINGGTASVRNIRAAALLNDAAQSSVSLDRYIAGGSIAAGTWRQVTIPLAALGVANSLHLTGFWLQDGSGSAQRAYYVDDIALVARPAPAVVSLQVDATSIVRTVDPRLFGVNAAVWDAELDKPATVLLLQGIGNRVLRFPGGSLSDEYRWRTNTTRSNTWTWATGFDRFADLAKRVGSQAYITVNYGSGTPQEAADWVRYSNVAHSYGMKYWEIGNECYGSWEYDVNSPAHDPYTYAVRAKEYLTRMKAVDPTIKVGVVASTGEDSFVNNTTHPAANPRTGKAHNGWTPVMLATLKSLDVTPDFLIYHRYPQNPGEESDADLLQSSQTWQSDAADLRRQLTDYLGDTGVGVELVCTENNSVSSAPGKQTTSLVNGLFLADSLGQLLQTEFNALLWWDLRNGQERNRNNSASLYGWRLYGDYGIVSAQNDPYPVYYVRKLLAHFAGGGDKVVSAGSDYAGLAVYAAKRSDGTLALLAINKSASAALNATIALAGFAPAARADVFSYGIPQDDAARTGAGSPDVQQTTFNQAGPAFSYTFPPYSVTVIGLAMASGQEAPPMITGYAATNPRGVPISSAPPGAPVLIEGSHFGAGGSVSFNGVPAPTTSWSPNEILASVPSAPRYPFEGPVTVTVNGQTGAGPPFTITPP